MLTWSPRIVIAFGAAVVLAAGCGGPSAGAPCGGEGQCGERLVCAGQPEGPRVCMAPCNETTRICIEGSVCLESPESGRLCWFGGRTPLGVACTEDLQCEPGTVCASGVCTQACTLQQPEYVPGTFCPDVICDASEQCVPVEPGSTDGVCEPRPEMPDAGIVDAGTVDAAVDAGTVDAGPCAQ